MFYKNITYITNQIYGKRKKLCRYVMEFEQFIASVKSNTYKSCHLMKTKVTSKNIQTQPLTIHLPYSN